MWSDLPTAVRRQTQVLVQGQVVAAQNCPGGFSPGFASRLRLAGEGSVFVKAMDATRWPAEADSLRAEAQVASLLPPSVPVPTFRGWLDDGLWVILAFEDVAGAEPDQPWRLDELRRVVAAIEGMATTPGPDELRRDHPRLGGWAELARDPDRGGQLASYAPWAAADLDRLVALEEQGLAAARGSSLVHFDLYAHNILLTPKQVFFVDWPHARLGAPFVDLIITLSSAAAAGLDPEPFLRGRQARHELDADAVTAVLAAHAGFCVAGGLATPPPGLEPIAAAKRHLGRGALGWLAQRLATGR